MPRLKDSTLLGRCSVIVYESILCTGEGNFISYITRAPFVDDNEVDLGPLISYINELEAIS